MFEQVLYLSWKRRGQAATELQLALPTKAALQKSQGYVRILHVLTVHVAADVALSWSLYYVAAAVRIVASNRTLHENKVLP